MKTIPRVWVGCLACYNEGHLNGKWIEAIDAYDITVETLHPDPTDHEELWIFDHEYIPVSSELSIDTAVNWGEAIARCQRNTELPVAVLIAVIQDLSWSTPKEVDHSHLEDTYSGTYTDFSDFAYTHAEDTMDIPDHLLGYFDWSQYADDLRGSYTEVRYGYMSYIFSAE